MSNLIGTLLLFSNCFIIISN